MARTPQLFSIAPLAVALLLTSPLLCPFYLRCSKTWALIIYQLYQLSLFLRFSAPRYNLPPPIFRKLVKMTFPFTRPSLSLWREIFSLSLSSAAALFTFLALNRAKFSIPFSHVKRQPQAWWSSEAVSKRRNTFADAHRSDKDCQTYSSAFQQALSVIAKAKTDAYQTTSSSLSPK